MKKITGNSVLIETIINCVDFSQFKYMNGENRKVVESHVKKLMASFSEYGTAGAKIIVIKTRAYKGKVEYYVADGQHSIIAATRLGLALNVTVVELLDDTVFNITKYVATLNNSSKAWSNQNYLIAFSNNGIREYKIMADILQNTGLQVTDLQYIFLGNGGSRESKIFKSGTVSFVNELDSMKLLDAVLKVVNVIPNKSFVRRALYKVMRLTNNYDKMANAILKTAEALANGHSKFSENESEFYDHLIKIYKSEFKVK